MKLVKKEFNLKPEEIIKKMGKNASRFNFIVRETFDMGNQFKHQGVDVADDFVYYSIMLCNPQKAYQSIKKVPIRGCLLLPPKQIVIYRENKKLLLLI